MESGCINPIGYCSNDVACGRGVKKRAIDFEGPLTCRKHFRVALCPRLACSVQLGQRISARCTRNMPIARRGLCACGDHGRVTAYHADADHSNCMVRDCTCTTSISSCGSRFGTGGILSTMRGCRQASKKTALCLGGACKSIFSGFALRSDRRCDDLCPRGEAISCECSDG